MHNSDESRGWEIYKSLRDNLDSIQDYEFKKQLQEYLSLKVERPSLLHSMILFIVLRYIKRENTNFRLPDFFRLWGFDKFRNEDWVGNQKQDGSGSFPSLAKEAIMNTTKDFCKGAYDWPIEDILKLVELLDELIEKEPDDEWIVRDKALLLAKIGKKQEAAEIYRSLILTMGEKFYIWDGFSDCVDDKTVRVAMLCKAISLEKNEDYIGKIRFKLAEILVDEGKFSNALTELKKYKEHRISKDWKQDEKTDVLISKCGQVEQLPDNKEFYRQNIPIAEDYVYSSVPFAEMMLIKKIKTKDGKNRQIFIDKDKKEILINPSRFSELLEAKIGQIWKIKIYQTSPLAVEKSSLPDWTLIDLGSGYGYIGYVNEEKKVYHINTPYNMETYYEPYFEQKMKRGDFVKFKWCETEKGFYLFNIAKCSRNEALSHFCTQVGKVTNVNEDKQLFHIDFAPDVGVNVYFNQTELRPNLGDKMRVVFYSRKVKNYRIKIEILKLERLS